MDFAKLCRALDKRLDKALSPSRAAHSRRVAELAAALCDREGLDRERGRAAGLAHDLCKELPRKDQRALAAKYSGIGSAGASSTLMADKIVHGPAAAATLERDFGVEDAELLEAVAIHTVGRPGMSGLAILLYCADKLEPGRDKLDSDYRRSCLELPPEAMLLAVVEGVVGWLEASGKPVASETMILYSSLREKAGKP